MSLFIGVNAEFPRMDSEQMEEIFNRLREKKWVKIKNIGRGFSTLWFARFKDEVNLEAALLLAEKEFNQCSEPHAKPRLVIHAGHNKPKIIVNPQ
jgi:hypothetical protein